MEDANFELYFVFFLLHLLHIMDGISNFLCAFCAFSRSNKKGTNTSNQVCWVLSITYYVEGQDTVLIGF